MEHLQEFKYIISHLKSGHFKRRAALKKRKLFIASILFDFVESKLFTQTFS